MIHKPHNGIFYTNYQKALRFLAAHPGQEFMEREIQDAAGMSKAGANNALRSLVADLLVDVEKKGRLSLYHVDLNNPLIRQIKVLINLLEINELVASIKEMSDRIIIFGSAAAGTDFEESDIDLFVVSNKPEAVRESLKRNLIERRVHLVVRKPLDYVASKKKDKIFYDEVSRGIVLFDKQV